MPAVEVSCPSCSQRLGCDADRLDQPVRCPRCGSESLPLDLIDHEEVLPAIPTTKAQGRRGTLVWGSGAPEAAASADGANHDGRPPDRGGTVVLDGPDDAGPESQPPGEDAGPELQPPAEAAPPSSSPAEAAPASDPLVADAAPPAGGDAPSVAAQPHPVRSKRKTTIAELSGVAQRLSVTSAGKVPPGATRQILLATAAGLTVVVLAAMALATGSWRWLLGVVAFVALSAVLIWVGLRVLPRLATRWGQVELPGRAWMWLGGGGGVIATVAALLTWGVSAATVSLAGRMPILAAPSVAAPLPAGPAADEEMKRQGHVGMAGGVLFVPPSFHSDDGSFDLLLHFHGNPDLVEESVTKVGLNAIVHITNLGVDSSPYERAFVAPKAFDSLVDKIVERAGRLGLRDPHVRRIAISSWSAGYGGLFHILRDPGRFARIDALLLLDGLHFRFEDEVHGKVSPLAMDPFVRYAREASEGRKLFWLTHSDVQTSGYANTTQTADHLLASLGIERRELDPETSSPPKVSLDVAVRAFPREARRWLSARSIADKGDFRVLGYAGRTPEDHMAHLIQMSVTVLPALAQRWR